ncbi:MAG: type III-B CRISPR module RAMP protein Cmr6, partial [Bacteroidales bacterium]|nr:type III-B CRISPR module RAMP protein Cmr6 [Bacteroidales bacterium]
MRYSTLCSIRKDDLLGPDCSKCQSPSLRLEKFVRLGKDDKGKAIKKDEIEAVVNSHKKHAKPIPTFEPKGAVSFVAKLRSRLIVNQAGGILENAGLCLHPHFGTPYIPGSAVKGIARHAAWCKWHVAWCKWKTTKDAGDMEKAKDIANGIAEVFGYPTNDEGLDAFLADEEIFMDHSWKGKKKSGSIAFLPAVPTDSGELVVDLVNCHHPKYYGGNLREATDDESPNPQFFPAVKENKEFVFSIVPIRPDANLVKAKEWLIEAITTYGAGAKTSAGYGWFDCSGREGLTADWRRKHEEGRQQQQRMSEKTSWKAHLDKLQTLSDEAISQCRVEIVKLRAVLEDIRNWDLDFYNRNIASVNIL